MPEQFDLIHLGAVGAICSVFTVLITQGFGYARFNRTQRTTFEGVLLKRIAELEDQVQDLYDRLRRSGEDCDKRVHAAIEEMRAEMRRRLEWDGNERRRHGINGEPWGATDEEDGN